MKAKSTKQKKPKTTFSFRTDEALIWKARKKLFKESDGRRRLSSKIEELLYDYVSR